jgi:hypothetical protein
VANLGDRLPIRSFVEIAGPLFSFVTKWRNFAKKEKHYLGDMGKRTSHMKNNFELPDY